MTIIHKIITEFSYITMQYNLYYQWCMGDILCNLFNHLHKGWKYIVFHQLYNFSTAKESNIIMYTHLRWLIHNTRIIHHTYIFIYNDNYNLVQMLGATCLFVSHLYTHIKRPRQKFLDFTSFIIYIIGQRRPNYVML